MPAGSHGDSRRASVELKSVKSTAMHLKGPLLYQCLASWHWSTTTAAPCCVFDHVCTHPPPRTCVMREVGAYTRRGSTLSSRTDFVCTGEQRRGDTGMAAMPAVHGVVCRQSSKPPTPKPPLWRHLRWQGWSHASHEKPSCTTATWCDTNYETIRFPAADRTPGSSPHVMLGEVGAKFRPGLE